MAEAIDNQIPWTVSYKDKADQLILIDGIALQTEKLEIFSDINNLFTSVHWIFNAGSNLMDAVENANLGIGTMLYFEFFPSGTSLSGVNTSIKKEFGVLSVHNGPGLSSSTLGTNYEIVLTSAWYFEQSISSKSYKGKVSDIVRTLIADDFPSSFSEVRVKDTYDDVAVRYRTLQKQSTFLNERVREYQRGNLDSSTYMFVNTDNAFEVSSYQDIKTMPQYSVIDMSNPHIGAFSSKMNDPEQKKYMLYPLNVTLDINNTDNNSLWDAGAPALVYWLRDGMIVKEPSSKPIFRVLGNDGTKKFSYISGKKNYRKITKMYIDESMQDISDAYSVAINKYYKDLRNAHTLQIACFPNIHTLLGRLGYYYISRSDNSPSIFAQTYTISKVLHLFRGFVASTVVTLQATSFIYKDETDVGNLYHVIPTSPSSPAASKAV